MISNENFIIEIDFLSLPLHIDWMYNNTTVAKRLKCREEEYGDKSWTQLGENDLFARHKTPHSLFISLSLTHTRTRTLTY